MNKELKNLTEKQDKEFDEVFNNQFCFDMECGSYMYHLTRVKEAFEVGTMSFDDFVEMEEGGEWEEETRERFKTFVAKVRKETAECIIDDIKKKLPSKIKMIHAINANSSAGAGETIGHNYLLKDVKEILKQILKEL